MEVTQNNEIKKYVDGRYVSSCEAAWRLFSFSMHHEFPHNQRLAIHLPDAQSVTYRGNDNPQNVADKIKDTTLTAWFKLNQSDSTAARYLYTDIPERYVWKSKPRTWEKRKRGFGGTIGRMYNVSITNIELFHLRQLLNHVPGATSFEYLRKVNEVQYDTFKEAALALGLLEDDDEWDQCLNESSLFAMPAALRHLYATILIFCNPANPLTLFESHRESMMEDYSNIQNQQQSDANYHQCLWDIEYLMQLHGKTLKDYGFDLPPPPAGDSHGNDTPIVLREQLRLVMEARQNPQSDFQFNVDQQWAFDAITGAINNNVIGSPKMFFIDGPGGTGKTYLFNSLLQHTRQNGDVALAMASSGTAALLLTGGRTAHSMLKIPLEVDENSVCGITPRSAAGKLIIMAKLIIWDEASMIDRYVLEAVDRTLKDLMGSTTPDRGLENVAFGGKVVVYGGDFRQVNIN